MKFQILIALALAGAVMSASPSPASPNPDVVKAAQKMVDDGFKLWKEKVEHYRKRAMGNLPYFKKMVLEGAEKVIKKLETVQKSRRMLKSKAIPKHVQVRFIFRELKSEMVQDIKHKKSLRIHSTLSLLHDTFKALARQTDLKISELADQLKNTTARVAKNRHKTILTLQKELKKHFTDARPPLAKLIKEAIGKVVPLAKARLGEGEQLLKAACYDAEKRPNVDLKAKHMPKVTGFLTSIDTQVKNIESKVVHAVLKFGKAELNKVKDIVVKNFS